MSNFPIPKEADITRAIRDYLKLKSIFHWKNFGGPMGAPGISDLLGCYHGRLLAIEIKSKTGRVSVMQQVFLDEVNEAGGIAFVARSVDDVIKELLSSRIGDKGEE